MEYLNKFKAGECNIFFSTDAASKGLDIPSVDLVINFHIPTNFKILGMNKFVKMRRTGPRPYRCVRIAWHSDRHHPLRGSLIQEIFRRREGQTAIKLSTQRTRWVHLIPMILNLIQTMAAENVPFLEAKEFLFCFKQNDKREALLMGE